MTTRASPGPQSNKLLGLEIIRFISALAVLGWHYQHFSYVAGKPVGYMSEHLPFYSVFRLFYDYGFYGVQFFWCISGFIFFWKYREAIASRAVGEKKFFILRFSRLYPLHFATLLLVAALQTAYIAQQGYSFVYQNNDLTHFAFHLFLASNWGVMKGPSFNGPIWSISVEVLVYGFFFLALRYVSKSAWVNVAVLAVCAAAKLAGLTSPIVDCLAFFYVGGLAAMAFQYLEISRQKSWAVWVALSVMVLAPVAAYVTGVFRHENLVMGFLFFYVPALVYVAARNVPVRPAVQKVIEAAGNMTYSSYLIHFPIQLAIVLYFGHVREPIPYESPVFFVAFMGTVLVASYYIYRLFEMPAQRFIRRRFGRNAIAAARLDAATPAINSRAAHHSASVQ